MQDWDKYTVADLSDPINETNSIAASADVIEAIELMCAQSTSRLIVIEQNRLAGVITLKDLYGFFSLKVNLQESGRL